jgi:ArsR family transcriptional regulator, arsenate/arsenite/antimonite-responsive transcriptional repressor / arsenate reductase (thioredoxin)
LRLGTRRARVPGPAHRCIFTSMSIEASADFPSVRARADIHAALADPIRVAIVDELSVGDRTPTELARSLGAASNLVAHHLGVLADRGIVQRRRSIGDSRRAYLRLVPESLEGLLIRPRLEAGRVLFVCTRNSARSQLAAAMWNRRSRSAPAESAGTHPAGRVSPGAIHVARRRGLDLSRAVPRRMSEAVVIGSLLVTVCDQAREELGNRVAVHWSVVDPVATGTRAAFEAAAGEIDGRVERLRDMVWSEPGGVSEEVS